MLNPTKRMKLNPIWEKRYKILRFFVFVFFLAGVFWLGYLILFPSQYFTFSLLYPDSSKNNLVGFQKVEDKLIFNATTADNFSRVRVILTLKNNSLPLENGKAYVRKSYQAFFYPIGEDILNSDDYFINSLISSEDSVFIVGLDKKFPIDNPLTFEQSGFNWNNVESIDGKDLSQYEKQGLFNIHDVHPDGTVFLVKEGGKYFYIRDGKKCELKDKALNKADLQEKAVLVEEKGLEIKKECLLKKSPFFNNRYTCTIPIDELNSLIGKDYQFNINIDSDVKINKIDVVLQEIISGKNFITSLSKIKSKIFLRYGL